MRKHSHQIIKVIGLLLMFMLALSSLTSDGKSRDQSGETVIYDFENDEQLDRITWQCGSIYERVADFTEGPADGNHLLKVEMFPKSEWPGFATPIKFSLAPYNHLSIEIFNPAPAPLRLSWRIDDRPDSPPYNDRANGSTTLDPGPNRLSFNLKELKTSDGQRHLDTDKIRSLNLFLHRPATKTTIYLDNLKAHDRKQGK